mmetsp:Transcript_11675/g.29301  ORF Transcript_11675/g.29301 Transcript_11675/m.29301 type:complete len:268 (-) Transcript_11675:143-946(-)
MACVPHLQLCSQLVQRAHRRHSQEAHGGLPHAVVVLPQLVQREEQLLHALDGPGGLRGLARELDAHQNLLRRRSHRKLRHLVTTTDGILMLQPIDEWHRHSCAARLPGSPDLRGLQPALDVLHQALDLELLLAELDPVLLLLHAEGRSQHLDDHNAPEDAIRAHPAQQRALGLSCGVSRKVPELPKDVAVLSSHLCSKRGLLVSLEKKHRSWEEKRACHEPTKEPDQTEVDRDNAVRADELGQRLAEQAADEQDEEHYAKHQSERKG